MTDAIQLLIGTRKGAWIYRGDAGRNPSIYGQWRDLGRGETPTGISQGRDAGKGR